MPTLRIIEGYGAGFVIPLLGERLTIGRDPTNAIQIGDPKASRIHAEIILADDGSHVLRDLGSSNGTWNEDGRVRSLPLVDGTTFRIGSTYLQCSADPAALEPGDTYADDNPGWQEPQGLAALAGQSQLFTQVASNDRKELERSNEYLLMLHQVVRRSQGCRSRDQLFDIVDDIAAEALEGDRCAVFLPSPESWTLWPPHERRLRARFGSTAFAHSLLNDPRLAQEPLLCTKEGDLDPSNTMVQAGVLGAMAAPLRIGNEVHALLYVDRLETPAPFQRRDLEFLAAVANQMAVVLANLGQVAELAATVDRLRAEPPRTHHEIIHRDPVMAAVMEAIDRAAPTPAPVLISGESGTGKELVARAIHRQSKRQDQPLLTVNCAAIAESLVESTLFGHIKGAYTGADDSRPGLFELADHGTVFLDEIGELPAGVQAKLLRVLEQGEVQRVGDNTTRTVDVRIIAATNRNLSEEIFAGRFREDLYHRLNVLSIEVPPLRERPQDIDLLIDHFLTAAATRMEVDVRGLTPEARALLLRFAWPGNVRQLRNTIDRMTVMCQGPRITVTDLPFPIRGGQAPAEASPLASLAAVERAHIMRVLDHLGGNKKASAEVLGIDRSTLYAKLRSYEDHQD